MHACLASTTTIGLAAILLFSVAAGCTPGTSDTTADKPTQADDKVADHASVANAPLPGSAIGNAAQGTAQLPSNFPQAFPMLDDFTITTGTFTPGDAMTQPNFLVQGTSPSSIADIAGFYNDRLPKAGYEVQPSQPVTPEMKSALVYFRGNGFKDASVQVSDQDGQSHVLISLPLDE